MSLTLETFFDNFEHFTNAPNSVAKLRELILQLAVQGKLVPQDAHDEPASVLLAKIKAEKERLIQEKKIKKSEPLPPIEADEVPFDLPKGWKWERLGALARFIDYRGKTPIKISSGIKLITAKNVRMGYISEHPQEFISEDTYESWMTRGFPKYGDVLFTTEAPLGNVGQLLTEEKIALAQRVINFQPFADFYPAYLKTALMSPLLQQALLDKASGMTAEGIKASRLKLVLIPIPPLAEQRRLVAKVDQLMALCDELEAKLRQAQTSSAKLMTATVQQLAAG